MNRLGILLLSLVLIILIGIGLFQMMQTTQRTEIRAVLDIGSGATNMKIAKVDVDKDKIISLIFEKSIPVPYQKHLEQSPDMTFDSDVMNQGIQAIKSLKDMADHHQVKKVMAVATAAFRKASNAPQFAQEIERKTGVPVRIIDQDEEGILAFRGALALSPVSAQNVVVWDIGGGSMQLTALTEGGTYLVDKGQTASIPFKNAIIQEVEGQDYQQIQTPNPINEQDFQNALKYAGNAALAANPAIIDKLKEPSSHVLAVGSLFNYGIRPLVGQTFDQANLNQAIQPLLGKTDSELSRGALAEVAVSNPILVLGYMKALEIPKVTILNVNNADGALTYAPYWE